MLNCLSVSHKCDRQTDGHSDSKCRASLRCEAKNVRKTAKLNVVLRTQSAVTRCHRHAFYTALGAVV